MAEQEVCENKLDDKIGEEISEEDIGKYKSAFAFLDVDGDGIVTKKQLETVLRVTLGLEPTNEEFQNVLKEMNADSEGNIKFEGFLSALRKSRDVNLKNHGSLFNLLDADGDGRIGVSDWQKVLMKFGISLTEDEVEEVMKSAGAGHVVYEGENSDDDEYEDMSSSAEDIDSETGGNS